MNKDYFTKENTDGFNDFDIKALNNYLDLHVTDWSDQDEVKMHSDRASNHHMEIISQYASENDVELGEDYFN